MTVNSVIVEDHYTKLSQFRKIIQPVESSFSSSSSLVPLKEGKKEGEEKKGGEPWFCVDFSLHPLDVVADYIFKLKVFFCFVLMPYFYFFHFHFSF